MTTPVPAEWMRGPADELAVAQGCTFDEAAGLRACAFVEKFCKQSKGRWAGKPLVLLPWQRDFLMRLFGWKRPGGARRYRRAYLEVAKKNGKSTMISAIILLLLLADNEGAPEIYLNACDRDQASIIFDEAAKMVRANPALSTRLDVVDYRKRILDPAGGGKIVTNSGEVEKQDGLNPSGIIFDELHRQKTRALWDVFEYAAAAREQPLTLSITTAGEDELGVWHEQRTYSEQVNSGVIPDTTHLGVVYRALEDDDLDSPATWRKANPSLGHTISEDDFAREWAEAKLVPVKLANFKRLRLNILGRTVGRFLAPGLWDACPKEPLGLDAFEGEPCWMGLDLSDSNDLTALAIVFDGPDRELFAFVKYWLPADNILRLEKQHHVPYRLWEAQGHIELTPGTEVDFQFIRAEVKRLAERFALGMIAVDPWQARELCQQLQEDDGLPVRLARQGYATLSEPTKELRSAVIARRLHHGGNPVLRWNADNAVEKQDESGNVRLNKDESRSKIDGLAALVNALVARTDDPSAGQSVYESRGILTL